MSERFERTLRRLTERIDLAEGFSFNVAVVDCRIEMLAMLQQLRYSLAARDGRFDFKMLDPEGVALRRGAELSRDVMEEVVLSVLTCERVSEARLIVLDASRIISPGDTFWRWLFSRMNEQRNTIAKRLGGPLLLVVTPRKEKLFTHSAPDFFSIRGESFIFPSERRPDGPPAPRSASLDLSWRPSLLAAVRARPEELQTWGVRLRSRYVARHASLSPQSPDMPVWKLLSDVTARSDIQDRFLPLDIISSLKDVEPFLKRLAEFVSFVEDHRWSLLGSAASMEYARTLFALAEKRHAVNDPEGAICALEHANAEFVRLLSEVSNAETAYWHSIVMNQLGSNHQKLDHLDEAMDWYRKALAVRKRLHERHPAALEYQMGIARNHIRLGEIERQRGEYAAALVSFMTAETLLQELTARSGSSVESSHELIRNLLNLGGVHCELGHYQEAFDQYAKATERIVEAIESHPDEPLFLSDGVLHNMLVAQLADAAGESDTALRYWQIARSLLGSERWIDSPEQVLASWTHSCDEAIEQLTREALLAETSTRVPSLAPTENLSPESSTPLGMETPRRPET